MKKLRMIIVVLVFLSQFTVVYAKQKSAEEDCAKWVSAYVQGLEAGEKMVSKC